MGKKGTNEGKAFELDVRQSCINDGLFYLRLNDTSIPFQNGGARFAAENPCDCLVFDKPNLFAIECKSTKYKSISFDREEDDKNMIKLHQINSLIKFSETDGIFAGFLLNFRNEEIRSEGMTYWMDIRDFSNFYVSTDKSSINRLDVVQFGGRVVEGKLKRTHFLYNIKKLISDIRGKEEEYELGI